MVLVELVLVDVRSVSIDLRKGGDEKPFAVNEDTVEDLLLSSMSFKSKLDMDAFEK